MTALLIYGILALVAPYAIFRWYASNTHVVYRGKVTVANVGLLSKVRSSVTDYDFLTAILPDGSRIVFEQSKAQLAKLKGFVHEPTVTIKRALFGAPYVADITWTGEKAASAGDTKFPGMYLSTIYFLLGFFALAIAAEPVTIAQFGHLGFGYAAFLLALSGFILARDRVPAVTADAQMSMPGLGEIGKGKGGVIIATIIAAAMTAASFWYGGWAYFVGMSAVFSLGMLLSMLTKR
jgi:hypothetical protein